MEMADGRLKELSWLLSAALVFVDTQQLCLHNNGLDFVP